MTLLAAFLILLSITFPIRGSQAVTPARLTSRETSAIIESIQDEIYDYDYQQYYFPEGGPVGNLISGSRTRVSLYIRPYLKDS